MGSEGPLAERRGFCPKLRTVNWLSMLRHLYDNLW